LSDEQNLELRAQKLSQHLADRYDVLSVLGQGGMGVVYKARHRLLNKVMAIKMLLGSSVDEDELQRFEREARAASKLSHPNIVVVHDFGITPDSDAYLVMDYIDGPNLENVLDLCGHLEAQRFLRIFSQICEALRHAHGKGVIHRDVKESNVMLVETEDVPELVKVVDFGLAKLVTPDRGPTLTKEGDILGTPLFMAPELCKGQKADARCDIYSLGCLMYRAVTGHYPFVGETGIDTMAMHIHQAPRSFAEVAAELNISSDLEQAILKAMEKEPDKRQQSMSELKGDIARALDTAISSSNTEGKGSAATAEAVISSDTAGKSEPTRFEGTTAKLIAAVSILTGMLAVFVLVCPLVIKPDAGGAGAQKSGGAGAQKSGGAGAQKSGGAGAQKPDGAGAQKSGGAGAQKSDGAGAQGAVIQLLRDHGFEEQRNDKISEPWSTEGRGSFGVDRNGKFSHHGRNNAWIRAANNWNATKQIVKLQPNTSYSMSCWLRDSGNFTQGRLGVRDSAGKTLAEIPFAKLHSYTRLSLQFNSESNSQVEVYAGFEAPGHDSWLQLDDFTLKETQESTKL